MGLKDSSSQTVVAYVYDAWGRLLSTEGDMQFTLGLDNPLRYRGYVYDRETGLYYLESRYYNPTIGRFINADSIIGTGNNLAGNNLFVYCNNNPVTRCDPDGHWSWSKKDRAILGTALVIAGIAILLAAPTGGSSLAFGAVAISASTAVATGGNLAITGTIIVGDVIAASLIEASSKPTSRNQMQKQVESGRAPKEVDRVDGPHTNVNNSQNHIHFKDGTAINQDGSRSHEGNGIPNITKIILEWILDNGWSAPRF